MMRSLNNRQLKLARRRKSRRGAVLICVLVCIGIATTIMMVSIRWSLRCRHQMRTELQLEQTRWLLSAGVGRTIANLNKDASIQQETWVVEPILAAYPDAQVESRVVESTDTQLRVRVTARLRGPDPTSKFTQRSRTFTIDKKGSQP